MYIKKYVLGAAAREAKCQTHVHEVQGMTEAACDHCHRFAGTTSEMIPLDKCGHKHEIRAVTDFVDGHYHKIDVQTGSEIAACCDQHIHCAEGCTSVDRDHKHEFELSTFQAPNPLKD